MPPSSLKNKLCFTIGWTCVQILLPQTTFPASFVKLCPYFLAKTQFFKDLFKRKTLVVSEVDSIRKLLRDMNINIPIAMLKF